MVWTQGEWVKCGIDTKGVGKVLRGHKGSG